jgi:hypothetical protein
MKEYEPKLSLRESDAYKSLMDPEAGVAYRALSPASAAQTYMGQGGAFDQRDLQKKGAAIQSLLAAAERRQQARTGKGSAVQSPSGSRGDEEDSGVGSGIQYTGGPS